MITKPHTTQAPLRLSLLARSMRVLSSLLFLLTCSAVGFGLYFWYSLPDVSSLMDPQANMTITVRDWEGQEHPFLLGPHNPDWTPLTEFPEHLPWAVIVAEDGAFYKHGGFDPEAIREALLYDLEHKRLARGASTITQQLAKNVYLSREKTLLRKVQELAIAWQLEKHLSKDRILELYLNLVELGPMVHGMTAGARYQLDKPVAELSAAESTFLAAILPGPRIAFNPESRLERVRERAASLLNFMTLRRVLTEDEYQQQLLALKKIKSEDTEISDGAAEQLFETACSETNGALTPERNPAWQLPRS